MTKSRRASDQRRSRHRAFNGYLALTEGSSALMPATETSPLTISFNQGLGGIKGMGLLPKKTDKPAEKPNGRMSETEARIAFEEWQKRILPPSLRKLYKRPQPEQRQQIIQAEFARLNRFALAA